MLVAEQRAMLTLGWAFSFVFGGLRSNNTPGRIYPTAFLLFSCYLSRIGCNLSTWSRGLSVNCIRTRCWVMKLAVQMQLMESPSEVFRLVGIRSAGCDT